MVPSVRSTKTVERVGVVPARFGLGAQLYEIARGSFSDGIRLCRVKTSLLWSWFSDTGNQTNPVFFVKLARGVERCPRPQFDDDRRSGVRSRSPGNLTEKLAQASAHGSSGRFLDNNGKFRFSGRELAGTIWRRNMTTSNWMPIVAALLVALGWFTTAFLNRKNVIADRLLNYRLTALESFLLVWFQIQKDGDAFRDPGFLPLLKKARSNFQLYGLADEIENLEAFISAVEEPDLEKANAALKKTVSMVRERIRKELGLPAYTGRS